MVCQLFGWAAQASTERSRVQARPAESAAVREACPGRRPSLSGESRTKLPRNACRVFKRDEAGRWRAKPRIVADSDPDQQEPEKNRRQTHEADLADPEPGDPDHPRAPLGRHQERP